MSNIYQTGQIIEGDSNKTTSASKSFFGQGIRFEKKESFTFNAGKDSFYENEKKEIPEVEEDNFYKKVFKTNLI